MIMTLVAAGGESPHHLPDDQSSERWFLVGCSFRCLLAAERVAAADDSSQNARHCLMTIISNDWARQNVRSIGAASSGKKLMEPVVPGHRATRLLADGHNDKSTPTGSHVGPLIGQST